LSAGDSCWLAVRVSTYIQPLSHAGLSARCGAVSGAITIVATCGFRHESSSAKIVMANGNFESEIKLSFAESHHAELVHNALVVDPELRPNDVQRNISVDGCHIRVNFKASQIRNLRAATGAFMDLLGVAVDTLEVFQDSIKHERA
jgi:tRNA threonylcarbamoyladenosine modification (KEOPS) complex  Pcc1 subunit